MRRTILRGNNHNHNNQLTLLVLGTALVGLVMLVVAVLPLRASGAEAQASTTMAVAPVGSLTPLYTPATPAPTSRHQRTPFQRPTPYAGPTVTAAGPLLSWNAVRLWNLYQKLPATLGGFKTITYEQGELTSGQMSFILEAATGLRYTVIVSFYRGAHPAYINFLTLRDRALDGQAVQEVQVGDLAYISPQDPMLIGVMQHRNAFVQVYRANFFSDSLTPTPITPLSAGQVTSILQDLLAWLSQR
jgi:hypothetical protein